MSLYRFKVYLLWAFRTSIEACRANIWSIAALILLLEEMQL